MSPDVASIVVRNRLRRPRTGMPVSWQRTHLPNSAPQHRKVRAEAAERNPLTPSPRLPQLSPPSFPNPLKAMKEGLVKIAQRSATYGQTLSETASATKRLLKWILVCALSIAAMPVALVAVSRGTTFLATKTSAGAGSLATLGRAAVDAVTALGAGVFAATSGFVKATVGSLREKLSAFGSYLSSLSAKRQGMRQPTYTTYRDIEPKLEAIKKRHDTKKVTAREVDTTLVEIGPEQSAGIREHFDNFRGRIRERLEGMGFV